MKFVGQLDAWLIGSFIYSIMVFTEDLLFIEGTGLQSRSGPCFHHSLKSINSSLALSIQFIGLQMPSYKSYQFYY